MRLPLYYQIKPTAPAFLHDFHHVSFFFSGVHCLEREEPNHETLCMLQLVLARRITLFGNATFKCSRRL
jgi:hypothetical protein